MCTQLNCVVFRIFGVFSFDLFTCTVFDTPSKVLYIQVFNLSFPYDVRMLNVCEFRETESRVSPCNCSFILIYIYTFIEFYRALQNRWGFVAFSMNSIKNIDFIILYHIHPRSDFHLCFLFVDFSVLVSVSRMLNSVFLSRIVSFVI